MSTLKNALLVSSLFSLCKMNNIPPEVDDPQFLSFISSFGRKYNSPEEILFRFNVYQDNLKFMHLDIQSKSSKILLGSSSSSISYISKINEFSDLTEEEFRAYYLLPNKYLNRNSFDDLQTNSNSYSIPEPSKILVFNPGQFSSIVINGRLLQSKYFFANLPKKVNWVEQGIITPVKNQSRCNSCYAFSAIAAIEAHFKRNQKIEVDLSEQELLDCDTDSDGCDGGQPDSSLNYVANYGIALENIYPYTAVKNSLCKNKKENQSRKLSTVEQNHRNSGIETTKRVLVSSKNKIEYLTDSHKVNSSRILQFGPEIKVIGDTIMITPSRNSNEYTTITLDSQISDRKQIIEPLTISINTPSIEKLNPIPLKSTQTNGPVNKISSSSNAGSPIQIMKDLVKSIKNSTQNFIQKQNTKLISKNTTSTLPSSSPIFKSPKLSNPKHKTQPSPQKTESNPVPLTTPQLINSRYTGLKGFRRIKPDIRVLIQELSKGPVIVAHYVSNQLKFYSKGIYNGEGCEENQMANHSALAVGYDLEAKVPYVLIKNSWGSQWGDNGYYKMAIGSLSNVSGICMLAGTSFNVVPEFK